MSRETVYAALAAKLSAIHGVKTFSRKMIIWDQLTPEHKPAIILVQTGETYAYQAENLPPKRTLESILLLYTAPAQNESNPAKIVNDVLDNLGAALAPDRGGKQTLGGLCSHCRIEGAGPMEDGALDLQGVTIKKISILLP